MRQSFRGEVEGEGVGCGEEEKEGSGGITDVGRGMQLNTARKAAVIGDKLLSSNREEEK
jgi:hypothetical protein